MPFSAISLDHPDGMTHRRVISHDASTHLPPDLPLTPPRSPCEAPPRDKASPQVMPKLSGSPIMTTITQQSPLISTYAASRRLKRKLRAAKTRRSVGGSLREGVVDAIGQTVAAHLLNGGDTSSQPLSVSKLQLDLLAKSLASGIASRLEQHIANSLVNSISTYGASTSAAVSPPATNASPQTPPMLARQAIPPLGIQLSTPDIATDIGEKRFKQSVCLYRNRAFFFYYQLKKKLHHPQ